MGANIYAFIQFDDNTPQGGIPFTNEPSLWNLEWDLGLWGCKDYDFIGAISGIRNQSDKSPLIPLRGCPTGSSTTLKDLHGEPFVRFLSYSEILRCLEHHNILLDHLHRSVQNVLCALSMLSERYGDDRVRLVFRID
jgi:hypothetical protein